MQQEFKHTNFQLEFWRNFANSVPCLNYSSQLLLTGLNNDNNNNFNDLESFPVKIKKEEKLFSLQPHNNSKLPFVWKDDQGNLYEEIYETKVKFELFCCY